MASTPFSLAGGKAAFGGMRNVGGKGVFDADDEDEDDGDGRQKVELREDSISLDQVRVGVSFACSLFLSSSAVPFTLRDCE